jgi:hypothetical protein
MPRRAGVVGCRRVGADDTAAISGGGDGAAQSARKSMEHRQSA